GRCYVGTAVVGGNEAQAVMAAMLDAGGKRGAKVERRGWTMKDRRDVLESMRAHYRRLAEPQRQMPALTPEANGDDDPSYGAADLSQVRPERAGGATVSPAPAKAEADSRTEQAQARRVPRG